MSASNLPVLSSAVLLQETAAGSTAVIAKASSTVLYEVEIDNTANVAATYLRLYNATSVTPGTTQYDWILMVPASVSRTFVMPSGITFATGLGYTAGTSATLATTTAPSSSVPVKLVYV